MLAESVESKLDSTNESDLKRVPVHFYCLWCCQYMLNEYAAFCDGTVILMLWSLIIVENTYLIFTIIKTSKNEFLQNTVAHNLLHPC